MTAVAVGAPRRARHGSRRPPLGRIPRAGWIVALLTLLNAVGWGLIVPPFHVPDETAHAFYAQYLAETGELPRARTDQAWYSDDELNVIMAQRFYEVVGESRNRVPSDADAERALRRAQAPGIDRIGSGSASTATSNPPLYYLPTALAYRLTAGADVTGRLAAMRLVSALMAALTALCVFMFLRELLPRSPLAWTVGGLAAGLQPMFAFVSSGVNNDAGLYLASAALFFALARLLRRGLTPGRAAAVGLLLALGVLVKTQMIAFAPGVALALAIAAWRARGSASPWASLGAAAGAALAPVAVYGLLGATVWDRPLVDRVGEVTSGAVPGAAREWLLSEQISYLWQLFLPRTPNLVDVIPAVPVYDMWLKGLVGRFGWLDYGFPDWVYPVAGGIWVIVGALAITRLWQLRDVVRGRVGELLVFGSMAAGLAVAIGVAAYQSAVNTGGESFIQARYLLPLLPLYALFPALAVGALGRRRAPVVAVLLVAGVLAHSVFAQLQTLVRFYG
jgi:4-amino-4-deoxy-L-arabinose transferase-like glycosyltransferase